MIVMLAAFSISLLTVLCYLWSGCRYLLLSVGFGVIFVELFWLPEFRESLWIQGISVDSSSLPFPLSHLRALVRSQLEDL